MKRCSRFSFRLNRVPYELTWSMSGGSIFRCRFGSAEVDATYDPEHEELRCVSTPSLSGSLGTNVSVEVSLNGQQFTASGVLFEYYLEARVSHLVPAAGPRQGGTLLTVVGSGFSRGKGLRCMLAGGAPVYGTLVSDSQLKCATPPAVCGPGACEEAVEISLNSESFTSDGVGFAFYNATVLGLNVTSGPSSGGTEVVVHGSGFVQMPRVETLCRFMHGTVVASFIGLERLRCLSPTGAASEASTLLAVDFAAASSAVMLQSSAGRRVTQVGLSIA